MERRYGAGSRNHSERHDGGRKCGRPHGANQVSVKETNLDPVDKAVLEISRYYWQSFAIPVSQSWMRALHVSEQRFGTRSGGEIGLAVLAAVQAMRMSRSSCFQFNNPACEDCAMLLSNDERRFINVFRAVRDGSTGVATTHAMILCEGNDTDILIGRMLDLARTARALELRAGSSCNPSQPLRQ